MRYTGTNRYLSTCEKKCSHYCLNDCPTYSKAHEACKYVLPSQMLEQMVLDEEDDAKPLSNLTVFFCFVLFVAGGAALFGALGFVVGGIVFAYILYQDKKRIEKL